MVEPKMRICIYKKISTKIYGNCERQKEKKTHSKTRK